MLTTVAEVFSVFAPQGLLKEIVGDDRPVERVMAVEDCAPGDLVFVDKAEYAALVAERHPSVVVTSAKLRSLFAASEELTLIIASNVALAHALIKQRYADRHYNDGGWGPVHPSAVVHETAVVDATAVIEPRAVVGRNVRIGARTRVMAGVVIENDATVGADTVVHPNAVIGYSCVLGDEVSVGAGAIIGSEGYGFAQDQKGRSHPIPQTGNVVIGDRVRIGANCCIDRAAYRTTLVGAGTKLDNLCHIAHNVVIGEDCLLTSMFCVAGSSTIGNRVMASGQTGVSDHVAICDDVVLLHRAGVTSDISQRGAYAGLPVQPFKEHMRNTAISHSLSDLRQRVLALEREPHAPAV